MSVAAEASDRSPRRANRCLRRNENGTSTDAMRCYLGISLDQLVISTCDGYVGGICMPTAAAIYTYCYKSNVSNCRSHGRVQVLGWPADQFHLQSPLSHRK